jgi:1,5-anhydro-D-fructose reductase (1,5-anhydro-D-mannitol-forming)
MNCLVFGYGYMGKIRCQSLRNHPEIDRIFVIDPHVTTAPPAAAAQRLEFLPPGAPIPWDDAGAVFVCTPNHVTVDLAVEALSRCGRVFCEKPPGRSLAEFEKIEAAARATPGHVIVFGFNHRLHPCVQAAKAMIGPGGVGDMLYIKGTYGKSGGARFRENWRNDPAVVGGGILLDQGIHMLDLIIMFAGPVRVTGSIMTDTFWTDGLEDNAFVLMQSEAGAPAFLHSSATLWKHSFNIEIGCRDGYLHVSGLLSKTGSYGRERLVIGRRQFEDEAMALGNPREEIIHFDRDESWDKEVAEFLAAIRESRPATHGTLEEAGRCMRILDDVYAAGRKVTAEVS